MAVMTPLTTKAQTCASSAQTLLTKNRLNQIAASEGIPDTQVELTFEKFVLGTFIPNKPIPKNTKFFSAPLRKQKTNISNVVPDGVEPLEIKILSAPSRTYQDSVFYESKATKRTFLPPSYSQYQILGFIDALSRTPAALAGEKSSDFFPYYLRRIQDKH